MKLLVVDDERPIVKHMDALLTGWGHQVVSLCLDGELTPADVLEHVKLQKFDVALVDFWMPSTGLMPIPPAAAVALRREGVDFGEVLLPFERVEPIFAGVFCVPRN